jgi:hypothetical protein
MSQITQVQQLPGVHYVCLNSDHASRIREPGVSTFRLSPLSLSSLSPKVQSLVARSQTHKRVFKPRDEGGLGGEFLSHISSVSRSVIFMIHTPAHIDLGDAMAKLLQVIWEDVVKYRILTSRLATVHGLDVIKTMAYARLINMIEEKGDFFTAYRQWSMTLTGRMIEGQVGVNFVPTDVEENGNKLEKIRQRADTAKDDGFDGESDNFSAMVRERLREQQVMSRGKSTDYKRACY